MRVTSSVGLRDLPRPVAVVVGGGGVLGAAQVGVGWALEQRGFVPDLIIGTSVGALNGAIAAAHPGEAAPWLDRVWTQARRREVFPFGYLSSRASVCADRGLRRLIARAQLPSRIEQLEIPFAAVATDLATGEQVLLDHGDLESALLASAAIPGVLPPVEREGRTLVDGGVIAYVPVRAALQAGAASVVVLPTGIETWPAPWDFGQSHRLIETACREAGRFLDGLRISGPGLYRVDGSPAGLGEAQTASASGVGR